MRRFAGDHLAAGDVLDPNPVAPVAAFHRNAVRMTGFGCELYRQIGDVGIKTRKLVTQIRRGMPPVTDLRHMPPWRNIVALPYALFAVDFLDI